MTNTYLLYSTVTTFQRKQQEAYNAYMETMKKLETAKGSQYYEDQKKAALEKRKAAEDQARSDARYWVKKATESMIEANKARKIVPPTAEQVAILQTMKMRTNISEAELDRIANAMDGNAMALGVVQEYAKEMSRKGSRENPLKAAKNYLAMAKDGQSAEEVEKAIRDIAESCSGIIESDGANRVRAMTSEYSKQRHGTNYDRDAIAREAIAENEAAFYGNMSSMTLEALQSCVNGKGAES